MTMLRPLGNTGLLVSPIAFGAFKIGRNQKTKYAQPYDLPTDQQTSDLLNGVLDLGINLIDTAPAYGLSEERIGRHLAHRRSEFILSTKVGETFHDGVSTYDFSAAAIEHSVERSRRRLQSQTLDILLLHSDGRDMEILRQTDAVATLANLKQRGLARFIGLSGKTPEGARDALAWADVLMIEYHPSDTSHQAVLADALSRNIGVLIKKPLAAGTIPPTQAIPWLLARGAHSLVVGGLSLPHVQSNLQAAAASA